MGKWRVIVGATVRVVDYDTGVPYQGTVLGIEGHMATVQLHGDAQNITLPCDELDRIL